MPIAFSTSFACALTSFISSFLARSIVARYNRRRVTLVERLAYLLEVRVRHALVQKMTDKCASSRPYQRRPVLASLLCLLVHDSLPMYLTM